MEKKKYKHAKICICRKCSGTGLCSIYDKDDILQMYPGTVDCDLCNGSGKVLVSSVTTTKIEPLFPENNSLIKNSKELLEAAVQMSVMLNEFNDQLPTNDSFSRRVDFLNKVIEKSLRNKK